MTYRYTEYKKLYITAALLFLVFAILNYKRILMIKEGELHILPTTFIIFQVIIVPISIALFGMYLNNIKFITNDIGIRYVSIFNDRFYNWNDFISIKSSGGVVKIKTLKSNIIYYKSMMKNNDGNKIDNINKQDDFIQEFYEKASGATFLNFSNGSFEKP